MAGKEPFVDADRLHRDDRLVRDDLFDPVDHQHGETMRQRRHHPRHIERADGDAVRRLIVHRPCVEAGAAGALTETLCSLALSRWRTSAVTSSEGDTLIIWPPSSTSDAFF